MFIWCSYCQRLQSEKPPFDNLSISHGICLPCKNKFKSQTLETDAKLKKLVAFQQNLYNLGKENRVTEAIEIIDQGVAEGLREVDIMLGFLAPQLKNFSSVEIDFKKIEDPTNRFVFEVIERLRQRISLQQKSRNSDVLLAALSPNEHILGIQLLELWLCGEAISTKAISGDDSFIIDQFKLLRPKVLGFSISAASQVEPIRNLIHRIKHETTVPPLFLVGGLATRNGSIQPEEIPEASFTSDMEKLFLVVKTHLSLGFLYELSSKGTG